MFPESLLDRAAEVLDRYRRQGLRLVVAESCTGGLLSAVLTESPGSSDVFERGFVTYSNAAKADCLAVHRDILAEHGAVSAETVEAMARGAILYTPEADVALSISGIAGPSGGTPDKPVGLVYFGAAKRSGSIAHEKMQFAGSRSDIRLASVEHALKRLMALAEAPET